jgi:hypothetical protein
MRRSEFPIALRDVAEARQMSSVAAKAGVSRESIYRMLSKTGGPTRRNLGGNFEGLRSEVVRRAHSGVPTGVVWFLLGA